MTQGPGRFDLARRGSDARIAVSHWLRPCLASLALVLVASNVEAGVPRTLTYQGRILDAGGPFNGLVSLMVTLYDAAAGGNALWQEAHPSIPVSNGVFTLRLGSVDPVGNPLDPSLFVAAGRWLGFSVQGGPELPRQPLASVPFAGRSALADAAVDGAVTGTMIAPGAITFDKLAASCAEGDVLVMTAAGWACGRHWSETAPLAADAVRRDDIRARR